MVFARPRSTMTDPSPLRIIGGTLGIAVGTLLLAPLAIAALAALGRRTPISVRLALRDLTRYQARSGSALAAITLAVGVAAAVAVSAATLPAAQGPELANLPTDQVLVYLGAHGHEGAEVIPAATPAQLRSARSTVEAIARTLHTTNVVALDAAVDAGAGTQVGPNGLIGKQPALLFHVTFEPARPGDQRRGFSASPAATLYVATPQLLAHLEIDPASIASTTDVLTSRTDLAGTKLMAGGGNPATARLGHSAALPMNTSGPDRAADPVGGRSPRALHGPFGLARSGPEPDHRHAGRCGTSTRRHGRPHDRDHPRAGFGGTPWFHRNHGRHRARIWACSR